MTILFPHLIHAVLRAGASDSSACIDSRLSGYADVDCGRCVVEVRAHLDPYQDSTHTFVHTLTTGGGRIRVYLPRTPYCSIKVTNTENRARFVDANAHMVMPENDE